MVRGIGALREALELAPACPPILNELANALLSVCRADESISVLSRAQQLAPSLPALQSNLLFTLLYSPNISPEDIAAAHRRWGEQFSRVKRPPPWCRRGRVRLGYVSGAFCRDPEVFFTAPLLRLHDRKRFEVFCYSNVAQPDEVTGRIRGLADRWRDISAMSDELAAQRIRDDRIDILIDCSGHFAESRLLLFALRPAPNQVSFPTYPATTGLTEIDYRFTDSHLDPEGLSDHIYTERLVRLPRPFVSYDAPSYGPRPAVRPVTEDLTFGCFNRFHKLSEFVIDLWSSILREAPRSRLLLHNGFGGCPVVPGDFREPILNWFNARGVSPDRIAFEGALPFREHLRMFNRIDIALDTFPYHGMTTSCESLWMGVPLVTLAGRAFASRVGVSLLSATGLKDWIACSPDEYVAIAIRAAAKRAELSLLRPSLRDAVRRSFANKARYTAAIEEAYTAMNREAVE